MIQRLGFPKFDDVGSFPLPDYINREKFNEIYWSAYKGLVNKLDILDHKAINIYFFHPLIQSLQLKLNAGVEIMNYPQHMDMNRQFLKPIEDYEIEPDLIDPEKALISEMVIIENYAKEHYERTSNQLNLKMCITGPIELYLKKHDFTIYFDMALNFAKSIYHFLKKSILNSKYIKTSTISIDEPSFGYIDIFNVSNDEIIKIFDKTTLFRIFIIV